MPDIQDNVISIKNLLMNQIEEGYHLQWNLEFGYTEFGNFAQLETPFLDGNVGFENNSTAV
jgi:hypothetical protein